MCCHLVLIPLPEMAYRELYCLLFSEAIWAIHLEEDDGLSGLALQSNSSKLSTTNTAKMIRKLFFLITRKNYGLMPNISAKL